MHFLRNFHKLSYNRVFYYNLIPPLFSRRAVRKDKKVLQHAVALRTYKNDVLYKIRKLCKNKSTSLLFSLFKYILRISAVRKALETTVFLALGSFGTLGPKLSHGTS